MKNFTRPIFALLAVLLFSFQATAHPMGNFSINHYSKVHISDRAIRLEYILDFAEIPTFQMFPELHTMESGDSLQLKIGSQAADWIRRVMVEAGGESLPLELERVKTVVLPGAGGLATVQVRMQAQAPWSGPSGLLHIRDQNFPERIGWKEIVIESYPPIGFPNGNPFASDRSNGLSNYPADLLSSAPNCTEASLVVRAGLSQHASTPSQLETAPAVASRMPDRLSLILNDEVLPARLVVFGLLVAFALGALHALSPGHGKTVVAAYLIGNRGTARHALFLGAVVTFTHTIGVFLLGFVTLFLSRYVVPETLYAWIGFVSGLTILGIGASLLHQRLHGLAHEHGPQSHTHEIPETITFNSLFGLGFSGGILPCPSALVVLLSAIALHRIAVGLLFIVAFSLGLASVLVGIGVIVVHAKRLLPRFDSRHWASRLLPALSAGAISLLGLGVAVQSLAGAHVPALSLGSGAFAVLGLGLFLGLKHATDADHVVAVTTFVSQERSLLKSCWIGAFWGLGHTLSLAVAGLIVIGFKVSIPEWLSARLEFAVALMLVALGGRALIRAIRNRIELRRHEHVHGFTGLRPLLVGAVHGAAGSAALMLLVLSTIRSPLEALLYIGIFGFGSMLGMLAISLLLALPLHWARTKVSASIRPIQFAAGVLSCAFGLFLGANIWMSLR
jgi:nickel/cobalt exporter